MATVDPTDLTGIDDTAVLPVQAWAQVKGFYDASNNPSIAQFGVAGSNSTGDILSAQNNDATISEFTASLLHRTIHRLDETTLELLESGTVSSVGNVASHNITTSGISGWTPAKDRYVIDASIYYVKLQVHVAKMQLLPGQAAATESLLVNTPASGAYAQGYTSDTTGSISIKTSSAPDATVNNAKPIAVHYMIIPQTNVPYYNATAVNNISNSNATSGLPIRNIPFYGVGGNAPDTA